jgi:hypothetical protein
VIRLELPELGGLTRLNVKSPWGLSPSAKPAPAHRMAESTNPDTNARFMRFLLCRFIIMGPLSQKNAGKATIYRVKGMAIRTQSPELGMPKMEHRSFKKQLIIKYQLVIR